MTTTLVFSHSLAQIGLTSSAASAGLRVVAATHDPAVAQSLATQPVEVVHLLVGGNRNSFHLRVLQS